jgi:hypothetical protein
MADERADGFVLHADRFQRLRNRRIGGKVAGIDAALDFGERHHEQHFLLLVMAAAWVMIEPSFPTSFARASDAT